MKTEQIISTTQDRIATWDEIQREPHLHQIECWSIAIPKVLTVKLIPTLAASSAIPLKNLSFSLTSARWTIHPPTDASRQRR